MWALANRLRSENGEKKSFLFFSLFDLRKFKRKGGLPISKFEEQLRVESNPLLGRRKNKVS